MTNFLSYRSGTLNFSDYTALVGPNGSGKSNAVAAIKLLRDIPIHGLPTAIARRGGFDQLRHRSSGRPYDPALRIEFSIGSSRISFYELKLSSIAGKRYEIKQEKASIFDNGVEFHFMNTAGALKWSDRVEGKEYSDASLARQIQLPPGQSALSLAGTNAAFLTGKILEAAQTLEINPAKVGELQEPSSTRELEPDGSNIASIVENMSTDQRSELTELLSVIVPGIAGVEVRHVADKITTVFTQEMGHGKREFFAKQMSDGTLRVFGILVAMLQEPRPSLLVIEEPEVAIHLGALQTLVEVLRTQTEDTQIVITTHSADIIDNLELDELRVVWSHEGASRIAPVAEHTRGPVRKGLITPGALLRADALDPSA
jgi:predicted ATPase